jgi:hypothetical protein
MNNDVTKLVEKLVGKCCSRKEVGRMRSLSLGFGSEVPSPIKLDQKIYREWEIGTYRSAWRVIRGGTVVCGSQDAVDSIDELNLALARIELGRFVSLQSVGDLDVRVNLDSGIAVDFLATASDEDESFHIFCPGERFVEFAVRGGWRTGPSDRPWTDSGTVRA